MSRRFLILFLFLSTPVASADEGVRMSFRLTGLFQPDRVDDLKRQAGSLIFRDGDAVAEIKLVDVNYDTTIVTYAYDAETRLLKGRDPEQIRNWVNERVRHVSRGSFNLYPPGVVKFEQLKQERIAVEGLDCKGCAFGAYRSIADIEGVERAIVSFKEGHVTAWIDTGRVTRSVLVEALKKAQVDVIETNSTPDNKQ